jgi:rhodanese-related sulfurtransferase
MVGVLLALAALLAVVLTRLPAPPPQAPAAAVEAPVAPVVDGPATGVETPPEAHGGLDPNGPQVELISVADAQARFEAGEAVFIDVRAGSDYAAGRIPGALTITSRELEARLQSLPPGAVIIAYGDGTRPESGQRGAQIFMELGYPTTIALDGGFQAWRDAGNPVEAN